VIWLAILLATLDGSKGKGPLVAVLFYFSTISSEYQIQRIRLPNIFGVGGL
jgi:hypothetical protein